MTTRLPQEPVRVTNWLAGWLDYVCATLLTAGRWLRVPSSRENDEQVLLTAFAPAAGDAYGHRWHDEDEAPASGGLIRALEIVMLSVSFFLAAHLLSGGTPTVSAPNLNQFGLRNSHVAAASLPVPAAAAREVNVPAGSFVMDGWTAAETATTPAEEIAAAAPEPIQEEAAVLAPATAPGTDAASVAPAAEPEPAPPPAPAAIQEPPPAPAAAVPAPEPAPAEAPAGNDRYLSVGELHAAALAAGWPAATLTQLEAVAWCESRFHTHAQNLGALGLMQVLPNWFEFAGLDKTMWWDPETNFRAALAAYNEHERFAGDPWSAWTCKP